MAQTSLATLLETYDDLSVLESHQEGGQQEGSGLVDKLMRRQMIRGHFVRNTFGLRAQGSKTRICM